MGHSATSPSSPTTGRSDAGRASPPAPAAPPPVSCRRLSAAPSAPCSRSRAQSASSERWAASCSAESPASPSPNSSVASSHSGSSSSATAKHMGASDAAPASQSICTHSGLPRLVARCSADIPPMLHSDLPGHATATAFGSARCASKLRAHAMSPLYTASHTGGAVSAKMPLKA
eukprot:1031974-Prymnesium_polylepis.1